MTGLKHEYAKVNNINLHYVSMGEGKLVVLLHGFPEYWYGWRNQIPSLSKNFKVIAPDLRGYNESEKPVGIHNYTREILVNDIVGLIRHAGYEKAHIVAHDWGGVIAWWLALDHPEMVDKLSVLNSPYPSIFVRHLKSNPRQMLKSWYMYFFQIPKIPELLLRLALRPALNYVLRSWSYNKNAFTREDVLKYETALRQKGALTAAINYYRAIFRYKPTSRTGVVKKQIQSPTLFIWGKNDRVFCNEVTEGMEKYFSAYLEIKYFDRCSHWVQHENPLAVNEKIIEFLTKELR